MDRATGLAPLTATVGELESRLVRTRTHTLENSLTENKDRRHRHTPPCNCLYRTYSPFYDDLFSLQLASAWLTCLDYQRDSLVPQTGY